MHRVAVVDIKVMRIHVAYHLRHQTKHSLIFHSLLTYVNKIIFAISELCYICYVHFNKLISKK